LRSLEIPAPFPSLGVTGPLPPILGTGGPWCFWLTDLVPFLLRREPLVFTMNFEGLDPSLAEYAPPLHPALDPVLDAHLNPSLLQNVELDAEGVPLEGIAVPESVHLIEGMYSELHTAVSEVGVPVAVSHFDLHEEMLWVGNHGVGARPGSGAGRVTALSQAACAALRALPAATSWDELAAAG